eukprot:TRINITY_DN12240_c0_g1_i2.p1 TRINITY_DN12240_c0_g1~~TRINITY_DN12240_c0_g1_i2.p1  ORF type:complete len:413 (-),score=130.08 TRINITY_DN12240_c0_g1_i2:49-1287(-)
MDAFLQRFGAGARESCLFDGGAPLKLDLHAVGHDLRGLRLAPGERPRVSFAEFRAGAVPPPRGEAEASAALGETRLLKGLKLDAVLVVRLWACPASSGAAEPQLRRQLGELRIPLRTVADKCGGALYHSWLLLSSAGGTSAAESSPTPRGLSDEETFLRALDHGHRRLDEPKVCVTLMQASDSDDPARALWTPQAPAKQRSSRWEPLLRSLEQHEALCALEIAAKGRDCTSGSASDGQARKIEALEAIADRQAKEFDELCARAKSAEVAMAASASADRERAAQADEERERAYAEKLRLELEQLQGELAGIGREANQHINAANEQIRSLRNERDDATRDVERQSIANQELLATKRKIQQERDELAQQKEALLKIVEDLHQTCASAGLGQQARASLERSTRAGRGAGGGYPSSG